MSATPDPPPHPRADLTRPRSVRAHDAVLQATRELLAEGGLPAATTDAISARSTVSKATIYNHWPSRTAIAAEAFGSQMAEAIALPDTGSARGDFTEQVRRVAAFLSSDGGVIFAQLLAAGVTDPHSARYFREFFLEARRAGIRELCRRGVDRGELRADVDAETVIDVLFGPLIFRLLTGHAPLGDAEARSIAEAALDGVLNPSAA